MNGQFEAWWLFCGHPDNKVIKITEEASLRKANGQVIEKVGLQGAGQLLQDSLPLPWKSTRERQTIAVSCALAILPPFTSPIPTPLVPIGPFVLVSKLHTRCGTEINQTSLTKSLPSIHRTRMSVHVLFINGNLPKSILVV